MRPAGNRLVASGVSVVVPSGKATLDVLKDVEVLVEPEERLCVLGPNGSGKSTLLRVLAGILPPTAGRIWYGSHNLIELPAHRRSCHASVVTQRTDDACILSLTVEQNIAFALMKGKAPTLRAALQRKTRYSIEAALKSLEAWDVFQDKQKQLVANLSGGERQMLALSMAVLQKPEILFLDEYSSALDPRNSIRVRDHTTKVIRNQKLTTILVTHNCDEALEFADKMLILRAGRVYSKIESEECKSMTSVELQALLKAL